MWGRDWELSPPNGGRHSPKPNIRNTEHGKRKGKETRRNSLGDEDDPPVMDTCRGVATHHS